MKRDEISTQILYTYIMIISHSKGRRQVCPDNPLRRLASSILRWKRNNKSIAKFVIVIEIIFFYY